MRDKDCRAKLGGKRYADDRRGAAVSNVRPGNKGLVQNFEKGKLEPRFETEPHEVVKLSRKTEQSIGVTLLMLDQLHQEHLNL